MAKVKRHLIHIESEKLSSRREDFDPIRKRKMDLSKKGYKFMRPLWMPFFRMAGLVSIIFIPAIVLLFGDLNVGAILKTGQIPDRLAATLFGVILIFIAVFRLVFLIVSKEHRIVRYWKPVKAMVLGFAEASQMRNNERIKVWIMNVYYEYKGVGYIGKGIIYKEHMPAEFPAGVPIVVLVDPSSKTEGQALVMDPFVMRPR